MTTLLKDEGSISAMAAHASKTFSPSTEWDKTTVYYYGSAGSHASVIGEYTLPTPMVGTTSGGLPNQCACVVSLRSAQPGRRGRGRMFIPCTGGLPGSIGQMAAADVTALATAWAAAFNAMPLNLSAVPVIVSEAGGSSVPITTVIIDTKVDIQRRRAKSELALFTSTKPVAG